MPAPHGVFDLPSTTKVLPQARPDLTRRPSSVGVLQVYMGGSAA
jgi:hypothetical protein